MAEQKDQPEHLQGKQPTIPLKASLSFAWYEGETVADEMLIQAALQELKCLKGEQFVRGIITSVDNQVGSLDENFDNPSEDVFYRRYQRPGLTINRDEAKRGFRSRLISHRQYSDQLR